MDTVSRKASRALRVLKHAEQFFPQSILKNLYISIIEPHFRYCSSVWGRIITNSAFETSAKPLLANMV